MAETQQPTIHEAAAAGDLQGLTQALQRGEGIDAPRDGGVTPLMAAAFNGQTAAVQHLISHQASLDVQSVAGWTALLYAAKRGHAETLRALLKAGANPHLTAKEGETAIIEAAFSRHEDALMVLLQAGVTSGKPTSIGLTDLIVCADSGFLPAVRLLVERQASVNDANVYGETALIRASLRGHTAIVAFLLRHGADRSLKDTFDKTAKDWAVEKEFPHVAALFDANDAALDAAIASGASSAGPTSTKSAAREVDFTDFASWTQGYLYGFAGYAPMKHSSDAAAFVELIQRITQRPVITIGASLHPYQLLRPEGLSIWSYTLLRMHSQQQAALLEVGNGRASVHTVPPADAFPMSQWSDKRLFTDVNPVFGQYVPFVIPYLVPKEDGPPYWEKRMAAEVAAHGHATPYLESINEALRFLLPHPAFVVGIDAFDEKNPHAVVQNFVDVAEKLLKATIRQG
ncbi:ankyrin repeat-containing protein [Myxococcus stipitatus DSM 14675]|uniref:Ankyrin repeat-containing protein n=1 Tax=Myxococcus stipitatus (strain DSM 14675 / JCM 12634 / Mx s8) TaxID=1278073 RepID=L7U1A3_MYXSD|nr:ankyrin repeat domain-containing protein [Myxococcus stipitatus]AGC41953.1 ankyrin repeat-containing protein [Myxococcus stipitatus DSM 14675]